MQWEKLIYLVIPLITAWIAFRSSGARRWVAIVATVAAAAAYAPVMFYDGDITDPMTLLIGFELFGIGLIAILILMAGELRHPSQWVAVGIGGVAVAAFFVLFALGMSNVEVIDSAIDAPIAGALLLFGVLILRGVPPTIDNFLNARERREKGARESLEG